MAYNPKQLAGDLDFHVLETLCLPSAVNSTYTHLFSEENVWKLCEFVQNYQPEKLKYCYVVFLSNELTTIPLWRQKIGELEDNLTIYDYHVILLYQRDSNKRYIVYDLDTTLSYPVEFEKYASDVLRPDFITESCFDRYCRVIQAEVFLKNFASDRSHMKRPCGRLMAMPPNYPCIATPVCTNNFQDFISMDPHRGVGEVMPLKEFVKRFLST